MKKHIRLCCFTLFIQVAVTAQNKVAILNDGGTNPGMIIDELRPRLPDSTGTFYISDTWQTGNVYLDKHRTLKNYPLKYDLILI